MIASRWAVEDAASARMMELLYEGVAIGLPPVDALYEARLDMLQSGSLAHPCFWAAWVLHR